jgi:transposase InsO family protein
VSQEKRDEVVEFVEKWSPKVEWSRDKMLQRLEIGRSKYYDWRERQGEANQHNGQVPRNNWLTPEEQEAILTYQATHPQEGYRRLTFMMLDEDVVATSPSTVYRLLKAHNRLARWNHKSSKKGTGFKQPTHPHQHWHIDITYINICGTFYYLCSILDGYSRYVVHWEIRESMCEPEIEMIVQRALERFPGHKPRLISDNGPQFIARDFKLFVRLTGMQHVRTSPYYPQSNGKLERWHQTLKQLAIRPKTPLSLGDARTVVADFVAYYNNLRLHSAIGYITPTDKLNGRAQAIFELRRHKLQAAREQRYRFWNNTDEFATM